MFRSRHAYRSPITHRYRGPTQGCPLFNTDNGTSKCIESHMECLKCLATMRNKRELCKFLNNKNKNDDSNQAHIKAIHKLPTVHPVDKRLKSCLLQLLEPNENHASDVIDNKQSTNTEPPPQLKPTIQNQLKESRAAGQPKPDPTISVTNQKEAKPTKASVKAIKDVQKDLQKNKPEVDEQTTRPSTSKTAKNASPNSNDNTISATTTQTNRGDTTNNNGSKAVKISRCPSLSDDASDTESCGSSDSIYSTSSFSSSTCSSMSMSSMSSGSSTMSDSDSTHGSPATMVPRSKATLEPARLNLSEKTMRKLKKRPLKFSNLKSESMKTTPKTSAPCIDSPARDGSPACMRFGNLSVHVGPRFVNTLKNYSLNIPLTEAPSGVSVDAASEDDKNRAEDSKRDLIKCAICGIQKRPPDIQKFSGQDSCRECSSFFESFMQKPKQLLCEQDGDCYMTLDRRCKACWIKICLQKFDTDEEYQKIGNKYSPRLASSPHVSLITVDTSLSICSPQSNTERNGTVSKQPTSSGTSPNTALQPLLMMAGSASPASDSITSSGPKKKKKKKKKKKDKDKVESKQQKKKFKASKHAKQSLDATDKQQQQNSKPITKKKKSAKSGQSDTSVSKVIEPQPISTFTKISDSDTKHHNSTPPNNDVKVFMQKSQKMARFASDKPSTQRGPTHPMVESKSK